jgi:hypothetical protein
MDFRRGFQDRFNHIEGNHEMSDTRLLDELQLDAEDLLNILQIRKDNQDMHVEIIVNRTGCVVEDVAGVDTNELLLYNNTYRVEDDFDKYPDLLELVKNEPIPLMLFTFKDNGVERRYVVLIGTIGSFSPSFKNMAKWFLWVCVCVIGLVLPSPSAIFIFIVVPGFLFISFIVDDSKGKTGILKVWVTLFVVSVVTVWSVIWMMVIAPRLLEK